MHPRSIAFAATGAGRTTVFCSHLLIKFHAQLCWSLEDMKKFAEGQIEQRRDYSDCVQDRDEVVEAPAEPFLRNRESQTGYGNGKKQD